MIVTGLESQSAGRVVLQKDHENLAWQIAKNFGNEVFASPEPKDFMEYLALNHDRGWDEIDQGIGRNPDTKLPYHLVQTPMADLLESGPRSVEFNTNFHPYCGLLASMHVWGLFNGRYGLSDKVVVDMLQGQQRLDADRMLDGELDRQEMLKEELACSPVFRKLIKKPKLMQNYKLLQFFDTLSLHFNEMVTPGCADTKFLNVPINEQEDVTVELSSLGDWVFRMAPFPFAGNEVVLNLDHYEVPKMNEDVDYQKLFKDSKCAPVQIRITR